MHTTGHMPEVCLCACACVWEGRRERRNSLERITMYKVPVFLFTLGHVYQMYYNEAVANNDRICKVA